MPSSTAVATTFLHEACTDTQTHRHTDTQTHRHTDTHTHTQRERERERGERERGMYNKSFTREELWSSGHNTTGLQQHELMYRCTHCTTNIHTITHVNTLALSLH